MSKQKVHVLSGSWAVEKAATSGRQQVDGSKSTVVSRRQQVGKRPSALYAASRVFLWEFPFWSLWESPFESLSLQDARRESVCERCSLRNGRSEETSWISIWISIWVAILRLRGVNNRRFRQSSPMCLMRASCVPVCSVDTIDLHLNVNRKMSFSTRSSRTLCELYKANFVRQTLRGKLHESNTMRRTLWETLNEKFYYVIR